ncbi:MAG: transposase [Planctomycetaceae bacterium]
MARGKSTKTKTRERRTYTEDFKRDAVQLHLDGQSAPAVAQRLGLSSVNLLCRWRRGVHQPGRSGGRVTGSAGCGNWEELRRIERERDILKPCPFSAAAGSRRLRSNSAGDFSRGTSECGVSHIERFSVWLSRLEA